MAKLVGLSSSYFAAKGLGIYDSVKAASGLGFETVELGAAHLFEPNVWETVKKIKRDFSAMNFTVHGLFPSQKQSFWFNASLGLTPENRGVLDGLFKAAGLLEAGVVGIHPGFLVELGWGKEESGFNKPALGKTIGREKAAAGLHEILEYGSKLAGQTGTRFAVENMPNNSENPLLANASDFENVFEEFPELGLLLDVGHALLAGNLNELLALQNRICEVHIHATDLSVTQGYPDHRPLPENFDLSFMRRIKQVKEIPLVFEHGNDVGSEEILREKKLLESFLKGLP